MSKKSKVAVCSCGGSLSTLDFCEVRAKFIGQDEKGNILFGGESEVDWESQRTAGKTPLFICDSCSKVYDSLKPLNEVPLSMATVKTMTEYDMTWVCPVCCNSTLHTYDDMIESGKPVCVACKESGVEMIRLAPPLEMVKALKSILESKNNS